MFFTLKAISGEGIAYYTDLKLGDTIRVYEEGNYQYRVFAFISDNNCFTCMKSLVNVCNYLNNDTCKIVSIVSTKYDNFLEKFKKDYQWNYDLIIDKIGAYRHLYKINQDPVYIITNNNGVINYIGVPGSAKLFNFDTIKNITKNLKSNSKINDIFSNYLDIKELTSSHEIFEKNNFSPYSGYFNKNANLYLISSLTDNVLYKFSETGDLVDKIDFSNFINRHTLVKGANNQIKPHIFSIENMMNGSIFEIDFNNKKIDTVLTCNWDTLKSYALPWVRSLMINDTTFIINQYSYSQSKIAEIPSMKVYFKNGSTSNIGKFDSKYIQYYLPSYTYSFLCLGNNSNIYEIQNLSDTIHLYNLSGKVIKNIYCDFDTTTYKRLSKEKLSSLNKSTPIEQIMDLQYHQSSISDESGILYDLVKSNIYVIYQTKVRTVGGEIVVNKYLHSPFVNKNHKIHDLKLPNNSIPVDISDDIITLLNIINDKYYFCKFDLKQLYK